MIEYDKGLMMIPEAIVKKHLPLWTQYSILEGYRGSHGHGTFISSLHSDSTDDIDIFKVVVQPMEYYNGFGSYFKKQEHYETFIGEYDILIYDIRKFIHLLSKGNPNVHIFLWLRPEDYFIVTDAGKYLISVRTEFLSQKVLKSFGGYAADQLKRMTRFEFKGYMGEKRKSLVEKYGYDCRNASHCIRLLLTAIDLLKTGELKAYREKDRDMLIDIKIGKWTFEMVKEKADKLIKEFERLKPLCNFPQSVPYEKLEAILLKTMEIAWKNW